MKRFIAILCAMIMLVLAMGAAAEKKEENDENVYYVYTENGKGLNVRSEPGGDIIGELEFGSKVVIESMINDNWAVIMYNYDKPGSGEGEWPAYINARYIIKIEPEKLLEALEKEEQALTGDMVTDINNEFKSAKEVTPYKVKVRPARITGLVPMRWVPYETGMIIRQYGSMESLTVIKETNHYYLVQDPETGDIGYVHKKFCAR